MVLGHDRGDPGRFAGARQQVIGERRGQRLAGRVVGHVLEHCPADPLDHRADRLARNRDRVDDAAHVLDRDIVQDFDRAGFRIDRDLGRVGAVGIGVAVVVETLLGLDPGIGDRGKRQRQPAWSGQPVALQDTDLRRIAAHAPRGLGAYLRPQALRGQQDRRARHHGGARVVGAESLADIGGRAVMDAGDRLQRALQRIGRDLREDGLDSLADGGGADMHRHPPVRFEDQAGVLARSGRAPFDERADGDAAMPAVDDAARDARLFPPAERFQTAVERLHVIAAVERVLARERLDAGQFVRHLAGTRQVAAAELGTVDAQIGGGEVEQALAEEISLEPARAAIGADGRFGGQRQRHRRVNVLDAVGAAQELGDVTRPDGAVGAHIGADVGHRLAAQTQDHAVAVAGDPDLAARLARVRRGDQVLAAILDPLDRLAEMPGGEGDQEVLRKALAAQPEPAADIVLHHRDGVLGEPQLTGERAAHRERRLGRARDGETRAVPFDEHAARLHRDRRMPPDGKALAPRIGGVREGGRRVALGGAIGDRHAVGRHIEQGRVLDRLDVERHRGRPVFRERSALRDHHRHGFAHEPHDIGGDHRLGEGRELGKRAEPDRRDRHPAQPVRDIAGGEHCRHAFDLERPLDPDMAYTPVRHRAPQDRGMQHPGMPKVVDIGARPGEETKILPARDRRADQGVAHGVRRARTGGGGPSSAGSRG